VVPPAITVHIETNQFLEAVSRLPNEDGMWIHRYTAVTTKLARESKLSFRQHQGQTCAILAEALMATFIVLISRARAQRTDPDVADN
jgi:hypothetical protein